MKSANTYSSMKPNYKETYSDDKKKPTKFKKLKNLFKKSC